MNFYLLTKVSFFFFRCQYISALPLPLNPHPVTTFLINQKEQQGFGQYFYALALFIACQHHSVFLIEVSEIFVSLPCLCPLEKLHRS